MDEAFFTCTLSRKARLFTIGAIVVMTALFLTLFAVDLGLALTTGGPLMIVPLVVLAGIAALMFWGLFVLAAYAPRGYAVDANGISIVRRNRKTVLLPTQEICSVETIDRKALDWCIRVWGVGGWFGSWGYFWSPRLGSFRAYTTNSTSLVLIRTTPEGLVVLSPDAGEELVARAKETFGLCSHVSQ